MPAKHLLKVEDLHCSFGGKEVLKGISFSIDKGETKVIIGPSGTGKTTILNNVIRLVPPNRGKIYLKETEITSAKNINEIRQQIGFVFQDFGLFNHLTAKGNVMIGLTKVKKMDKKKAEDLALFELERVGLQDFVKSYPSQLSGGQKQRVGIARALAMHPKLILFDEPTSALDPELTGEVLKVIRKLAEEGMTMLIVTHEMEFARSVANELIFMEAGKIVEQGNPEKLFTNPDNQRTREFLSQLTDLYGEGDN